MQNRWKWSLGLCQSSSHHCFSDCNVCISHLCGLRKCRLTHIRRGSRDFPFLKSSQLIPVQWYQLRYQIWLSRQGSGTNYLVWLIAWIGKCVCICVRIINFVSNMYIKFFPPDFLIKVYNREESFSKRK